MITNARGRAKRKGLPFDLDYPYLESIWPDKNICPVLNIEMIPNLGCRGATYNSPTLDRIIPDKGYVKGNVIVISSRANQIKSDALPKEMYQVADFFYELINEGETITIEKG
jgi:hypothetical protein